MGKCPFQMVAKDGTRVDLPQHKLRADMPPLPERMKRLPVDERGYPVPYFVEWQFSDSGLPEPEFRAMRRAAQQQCIEKSLCWVCGAALAGEQVFVIGPMCTVNRVSSEPPSHRDCARFSAQACPFLSRPHMVRREGGMPEPRPNGAGLAILRNPGVTALWFAKRFEREWHNGWLWRMSKEPLAIEWYCKGRTATRAEVEESIASGTPALREVSSTPAEHAAIDAALERVQRWLPRAA